MKQILGSLVFWLSTFSLFAQDSSSIVLEDVTVSANILKTDIQKAARNISVITSLEIEKAPVKSIDGILQYALNIDVRSRSPMGVQADISIRGGHFDQTLIMVDGIKMNDPQTGHHSLNLPVPVEMIERIEVLQGGASRIFGPSAFAGVINIITKRKFEKVNRASIVGGENGLLGASIQSGFQKEKVRLFVNGNLMRSDGYAYNTAFDRKTAYAKLDFDTADGFLSIQGGLLNNAFGASNFYFPSFYDQYEEVQAKFIASTWQKNIGNKFSSTINAAFRQHHDLYDFNNYRESNLSSVNFHRSDVADIEWKGRFLHKNGATAFGLGYRNEYILSNRLGQQKEVEVPIPNYEGQFYDQSFNRGNWSSYFEQQFKKDEFLITAGALLNYNSQFGAEIYPGIDMSYFISDYSTIYASANRSVRLPTFTELYLNTSTVQADENLLPEKGTSYEIGYKLRKKSILFNTSVFYRSTSDAIDKVKRPELPKPTMENIDHINFAGVELNSKYDFGAKGLLKNIQFNYAYLLADRKEVGFQSFYTLNYLKHKASIGVDTEPFENFTAALWYTFKDRQGSYQFTANEPIIPYENVHLMDLRLTYQLKGFRLFVDVNNLLGYNYFEFGFVEQPRRWISGGLSYAF